MDNLASLSSDDEAQISQMRGLVEGNVVSAINWYQKHKSGPRRFHRLSLVVTIALGAILPILAAFDFAWSRLVTGGIGVTIAAVAGLSSAYKWESSWKAFTIAQTELDSAYNEWKLVIAQAESGVVKIGVAWDATGALFQEARQVRKQELTEFFSTGAKPEGQRFGAGPPGGTYEGQS